MFNFDRLLDLIIDVRCNYLTLLSIDDLLFNLTLLFIFTFFIGSLFNLALIFNLFTNTDDI